MIGSAENDAAIRLECWKLGMAMAGANVHDVDTVDKLSTAVYTFVARDEKSSSSDSRDKSKPTPKR